MPRNIEIKARIERIALLHPKATAIADRGPVEIAQDDTFFRCDNGRLKLRMFSDGETLSGTLPPEFHRVSL